MKKIAFILFLTILFISCSRPQQKGGIIFTFDDQAVSSWYKHRELFKKYDIKATFFVNRPQQLSQQQIDELKALQSDGHEIACHGLNHIDARIYPGSASSFYWEEVEPAMKIFDSLGFRIVSFAYAFGLAPDSVDAYLLSHKLKFLRKATWNMYNTDLCNYDKIYARPDSFNVVSSMGIDINYNISLENLEIGISRAEKNNEVLVLHAHNIDDSGYDYTINPKYLERVFALCKKDNISSYRIMDLENFFKHTRKSDKK
jgi:peptidoglycan-N-acetylglucosamine deacetylase